MPVLRLTDLSVRSLPEGLFFDDKLPSFGIRVGKNRKTWIVIRQPNRTKHKLGYYPSVSLAEARQLAFRALGSPHTPKAIPAYPEARAEFLAQERWRPKPRMVLEQSLTKHFPWTKQIDKITHQDVLAAIEAVPTAGARSHALKDIRTFFNWTIPRYLDRSPAAGIKMPPYIPRERVLTDDELKRVWIASEQCGTFGVIVRLLILTGQRRGEIAALHTSWIHNDHITIPGTVTKNGKEHTFPAGISVKQILKGISQTGMMFPARGNSDHLFSGWSKSQTNLQTKSKTSDWTLHDLRRTFATGLASLGVPIHVTEKILNHISGTTGGLVGVYQRHRYWDEQVQAIEAWENKVLSLVRHVVPLTR